VKDCAKRMVAGLIKAKFKYLQVKKCYLRDVIRENGN
jgi:hypothetical protein